MAFHEKNDKFYKPELWVYKIDENANERFDFLTSLKLTDESYLGSMIKDSENRSYLINENSI